MQRALVWPNLYGHEDVHHKLKNRQKCIFVFLGCFCAYVGQPQDHIGWVTPMPFSSINLINSSTNPGNFHEKIMRIGRAGKWCFFESAILIFFSEKEKKQPVHMRYDLFLQYGWFLQNLGKDFIWTNMHTTVL